MTMRDCLSPDSIDEAQRLAVLDSYRVVDTSAEAEFDHVVQLAAALFQAPIALISFVHADRQFFKARVGLSACETSREVSFCAHALSDNGVLVVPDALDDRRFRDNPLVTGEPFIRFYAGAPIVAREGLRLGTVCIIDTVPRPPLTSHQGELLRHLARIVVDHLEKRRLSAMRRGAISMAAATPDAIVCCDAVGAISFWNAAAERMFGFTRAEAIGRPLALLVPAAHRAGHEAGFARAVTGSEMRLVGRTVRMDAQRRDGALFPIELSLAAWSEGGRPQFGSIIRDASEKQQAQERVHQLTRFDRLTGLPNRSQFLERVDATLMAAGRLTVLKIGLDRFKAINGTLGMAAGDLVLVAAAQRLGAITGAEILIARLGADEFGLLVPNRDDPIAAGTLARDIIERLSEPLDIDGSTCRVSASIGVVLSPGLARFDHADAVLKGALLALQHAKTAGGRRFELFRPQLGQQADERRRLEEELRRALERGEFELHYQPQVTLPDGRLIGTEALLRWRHPQRGLLPPAAFLPVLERSEMAVAVGRWIIREACAFAAAMVARGVPIRVAVNLFEAQLRDPSLFDDVEGALAEAGLPPRLLEVEITETTVLGLEDGTIELLRRLRRLGIGVAFDDYGTGYASLSLLKRYPLTRLKIDREFVRDIRTDPDDDAIVRAVIALGASLELDVIAEGIETPDQAAALTAFGCREAQGYLFGRPMPEAEFEVLELASWGGGGLVQRCPEAPTSPPQASGGILGRLRRA